MLHKTILTSASLYEQDAPSPVRPVAAGSDPSMDEALRRARRLQAIAEAEKAAALYDAAGEPAYAAGLRSQADRMRQALTS
ncbi:hypothetical protein OG592_27160 [Streptomyces avidinii]|uniref:hypothetical protein n=1 Tax=Streptomyces avidinii TaxID=1895 RepID=UPI00386BA88A|nr:hypothetical protein OG592_27160 [Streptomyces avidinii]